MNEETEKRLDEIERRLLLSQSVSEIANEMGVRYALINDTIQHAYLDKERYKKLIELRNKNKRRIWQSDQGFHLYRYNVAKSIANNETSLEKIQLKYYTSIVYMLLFFSEINDTELYEKLKPTLEKYGFLEKEKKTIVSLKDYSPNMQRDIALLGLTYRISFQNLALIFNTSVIEIAQLFFRVGIPRNTMDSLFLETLNEKEEYAQKAFRNAQIYLLKREHFRKNLEHAKKEANVEKMKKAKQRLKELHAKIDDSVEEGLKKRKNKNFTQEEQDLIARYQMKYDLTTQVCSQEFGVSVAEIVEYNKNLVERDAIFSDKWLWHQTYYANKLEGNNLLDFSKGQKM